MLTGDKLKIVQDLIVSSSKEELAWMSGYFAGIATGSIESRQASAVTPAVNKITIAYGTETGNSKKLATTFAATAKKKGVQAKLVSLDQYRITDLPKEEYFFTIISTQGEGEPPAAAQKFYDHIHQNGFKVEKLKYGVLALGDTSYPLFCKAGEDIDLQLKKLGGERIVSLQKCDIDYESKAGGWFSEVLERLQNTSGSVVVPPARVIVKSKGRKTYSGTVLRNINLNDRGSNKQTHHIEIASEGLEYAPGDSIGIIPQNPVAVIESIISLAGIDKNDLFEFRSESLPLYDVLKSKLNILYLPERVVKKYAELIIQDIPETRMGLLDLLKIYPVKEALQFREVVSMLEPITPRLYSISSSREAHGEEVHITVARDQFSINDELQCGLCSNQLLQLPENTFIEFYIHKNDQFRLPTAEKDVIMIGPGTGIAPFRSFLAERDATGAVGRNWLFFGEQHFVTDFLYQSEIQNWLSTGVLTKVNVAFSRDQQEKIYVQHKMRKHGKELFEWIHEGAYLYVCGAKEPMSVDVENTLLEVIGQQGNFTPEESGLFLNELKIQGRYLRDVY